jgi:hypothetical protein
MKGFMGVSYAQPHLADTSHPWQTAIWHLE